MQDEKERPVIGMLLDIVNLYGEHEGRMAPWIYVLCIGLAPTLIYVYFALWNVIPLAIFVPLNVFLIIRLIMKFPGREKYRVEIYKRQLNDKYVPAADLMNIKMIHPDGCIEYINGNIMYIVNTFNGTVDDEVQRSVQLRKLIDMMTLNREYDIHIMNVNDSQTLRDYYTKVNAFDRNVSARNFIKMIDHTIKLTNNTSMVQSTIFCIRGRKSDWKDIKHQIDTAIGSRLARCYKTIYRVTEPDEINAIFNRDCDSVINIEELMRKKYATEEYASSKVLAYDLPDDQIIIQGKGNENPVLPETPKKSFHVQYKGD